MSVLVFLGACGKQPETNQATQSSQMNREQALMRCAEKAKKLSSCMSMTAPERMHGVWIVGFEESQYLPNATSVPLTRTRERNIERPRVYLDIDAEAILRRVGVDAGGRCPHAIALDFTGRRNADRGKDYLGIDDEMASVDRVFSARLLGTVRTVGLSGYDRQCATPEPSREEQQAIDEAESGSATVMEPYQRL